MHFSLSTIAAVAAILAAAEAAPHGRHHSGTGAGSARPTGAFEGPGGRNGTDGAARGSGRPHHSGRPHPTGGDFTAAAFSGSEAPFPTGVPFGSGSGAAFPTGFPSFPSGAASPSGGRGRGGKGKGHGHHSGAPFGSGGFPAPSGGFSAAPSGDFPVPSGTPSFQKRHFGSGLSGLFGDGSASPSGGFFGGFGGKGKGHHSQSGAPEGTGSFPIPSGNSPFPSGGEIPSGIFPSDGGSFPTGGFPTGGFPTSDAAPAPTEAPTLPSGGVDVSSISFEFPSTADSIFGNQANAADDDEDEDEDEEESSSAAPEASTTEAAPFPTVTSTPTTGSGNSTGSGSSGNSTGSGSATATTTFPEAAGESTLSEPMVITDTFDGGMVRFGRGVSCSGQSEGGDSDAVFQIEEGGTLKNVIIGADQSEGVHCMGACTIENVWWEAVCEDALTIKQESGTSYVKGGGAKGAEDKVIQHNGGGTVNVQGFYFEDFGKAYRSCGNCDSMFERHIVMDGVYADGGSATFVGINSNYGDTATITNSCITNTETICEEFEGNDTGDEPTSISTGISASCIYTEADISAC